MAENFSSTDPSDNRPMHHGEVDSGGDVISFLRVRLPVCLSIHLSFSF